MSGDIQDPGPMSPDGYVVIPDERGGENRVPSEWIGGRPDQAAIDALKNIRHEAAEAKELVSYGLAGSALKMLGVEV